MNKFTKYSISAFYTIAIILFVTTALPITTKAQETTYNLTCPYSTGGGCRSMPWPSNPQLLVSWCEGDILTTNNQYTITCPSDCSAVCPGSTDSQYCDSVEVNPGEWITAGACQRGVGGGSPFCQCYGQGGGGGGSFCGDGTCDSSSENSASCPADCNGNQDDNTTPTSCSVPAGNNKMTGCVYNDPNFTSYKQPAPEGPSLSNPADSNSVALNFNNLAETSSSPNCRNVCYNADCSSWGQECDGTYNTSCSSPTGVCENYSILWRGNFTFTGGEYQFTSSADDGYNVYVCNTDGSACDKVIDRLSYGIGNTNQNIAISSGRHQIKVEWKQGGGNANVYLRWNLTASFRPDLIASAPAPADVTVGTPVTFLSTVSNAGAAPTGAGFSNFFQIASNPNGNGNITNLASTAMGALGPGRNDTAASPSHTFSSSGTFSVRACADKTNPSNAGTITESDENNNCSAWTNVTVNSAPCKPQGFVSGSASPASVPVGGTYNLICDYGATSGYITPASTAATNCSFTGWTSGTIANFSCTAVATPGTYSNACRLADGEAPGDHYCSRTDPINNINVTSAPVSGACGSADGRTYPNGSSSYAPYAQCGSGTPSATTFPAAGSSVTWVCSGQNGGSSSSNCSASQATPPGPTSYLISLTKGGYGMVTSSSPGINCGSACTYQSASFGSGTTVTLTPTTGSNRIFVGWGGDCSSAGKGVCTLNMDSNKTVIAVFTIDPIYQEF